MLKLSLIGIVIVGGVALILLYLLISMPIYFYKKSRAKKRKAILVDAITKEYPGVIFNRKAISIEGDMMIALIKQTDTMTIASIEGKTISIEEKSTLDFDKYEVYASEVLIEPTGGEYSTSEICQAYEKGNMQDENELYFTFYFKSDPNKPHHFILLNNTASTLFKFDDNKKIMIKNCVEFFSSIDNGGKIKEDRIVEVGSSAI